jgi:serine protease Do
MMSHALRRLLALGTVFLLAFAAVFLLRFWRSGGDLLDLLRRGGGRTEFRPEQYTLPGKAPLELGDVELLARLNAEYARLTQAVVPSVVSINTLGTRTESLVDFFGRAHQRHYPTRGQGSGVIVTEEGHIVTNHHVIANFDRIQVTLHGGKVYPAELIGFDELLDVAVIKVLAPQEEFVPLKLGDSSAVEVGQMVFAVGNPFGLGETVTSGIISAKERSLSDTQRDLFQTDAAINPGNSGGPLVNLRGEIIGINVAIFTLDRERPGFQGVGFSIPSNDVREALSQILERGRPVRGFLGVSVVELSDVLRATLNYGGPQGAVVRFVNPGSPAETAGLQEWDILLEYDGQPIQAGSQLISLIQRTRVGREVPIKIWRNNQVLELQTVIAESGTIPAPTEVPHNQESKLSADEILGALGVAVRELTDEERRRGFRGVVVTQVVPGALADGVLEPVDLVLAVNHAVVDRAADFYKNLAASATVQSTSLHILRGGRRMRVNLPPVRRQE